MYELKTYLRIDCLHRWKVYIYLNDCKILWSKQAQAHSLLCEVYHFSYFQLHQPTTRNWSHIQIEFFSEIFWKKRLIIWKRHGCYNHSISAQIIFSKLLYSQGQTGHMHPANTNTGVRLLCFWFWCLLDLKYKKIKWICQQVWA